MGGVVAGGHVSSPYLCNEIELSNSPRNEELSLCKCSVKRLGAEFSTKSCPEMQPFECYECGMDPTQQPAYCPESVRSSCHLIKDASARARPHGVGSHLEWRKKYTHGRNLQRHANMQYERR
eukprot:scaffold125394_cov32-Tisochrysis_lutea.AAC.2